MSLGDWNRRLRGAFAVAVLAAGASNQSVLAADVQFERDLLPLLKERCVACHGPVKQEAGLRLDAGTLVLRGADAGDRSVVQAHRSGQSELIARLLSNDPDRRMPPSGARLSESQIALFRSWIDAGAAVSQRSVVPAVPAEHWAFQPIRRPPTPRANSDDAGGNPIDAFLNERRRLEGFEPSRLAEPAVLLRRVHLDLLGVPPTIAEQDDFLARGDWKQTVENLLDRPEYGERWARHWLDVVRYADSNGYERDAEKPFVWRYRDYVIRAMNDDKPFDRFILEQIAGDELPDRSLETHIATGFLRLGHWDDEPADPPADRYDQLDDVVSTVGQAFLGLTIGCARCHDHKFEPLLSKDYYGLIAVFNPLERPRKGREELTVSIDDTAVYAWREPSPTPPVTRILKRGSPSNLGDVVEPSVPAVLVGEQPQFLPAGAESSLRRLSLARWIASGDNPLTARVIVNRVWQQHFGDGLVTTANDFGLMGAPPSHPELLDWLADWFVRDANWSLKRLHALILESRAWRSVKSNQSPMRYRRLEVEAIRDSMLAVSGALNSKRFGPPVKLPIPLAAIEANTDKQKAWNASNEEESSRRSVYAFIKRGLISPMLETLDLADSTSSCPKRQTTTVATQALCLFNGDFTMRQARRFAVRLQREAGDDRDRQIRRAWRLALCREPQSEELELARRFLDEHSPDQLCRVLFNLNEFVYSE